MSYPVSVAVEARLENRDRLTTAFRPILAIPHTVLVGPPVWMRAPGLGLLGGAAYVMAIVSWFTILVNNEQPRGIRDFHLYYLRWRARALAYMALLADTYPPFGDVPYPVSVEVAEPSLPRDRATIAVRILLALPHVVLLCFLIIAWLVTIVIAWLAILLTGACPAPLFRFGVSVMRWLLRVEAYLLLLVDEYPPFALD
jgi:hypothetical protein